MEKVGIFICNGSEDIETIVPADIWDRAGLDVKIIGIEKNNIIQLAHGTNIKVNYMLNSIDNKILENLDIFYIPGGDVINSFTKTNKAEKLKKIIISNYKNPKKIFAALCAAPYIFNNWGILNNKKITTYPGVEIEGGYENKIAKGLNGSLSDRPRVYIDTNIITGNGPGSSFQFSYNLLNMIGISTKNIESIMQWE